MNATINTLSFQYYSIVFKQNKKKKEKHCKLPNECTPFQRNKMFEISQLAPSRKQLMQRDKQQVKKIITRLSSRRH